MGTIKNCELLSTESYFQDLFTSLFSKNKLDTPLLILDTRNFPVEKIDAYKNAFPPLKIAFITELPFTPEKLKPLFTEHPIDFILPADLQANEAQGFVQALRPSTPSSLPPASLVRYKNHLYESLKTIFALDPSSISEVHHLRNAVHKIAGSSAVYGYPALGHLAKELDIFLTPFLESNSPLPPNFTPTYQAFLRNALFAIQKINVL